MQKKKSIKNFISCVVFLCLVAVIFVILTYVFRPPKKNSRRIITDYYNEQKDSLDVVALGASGTYRFFNPMVAYEEYGFTSYTYAAASMQASCYITALKDILRTQSPDLVLVDARRFTTRDTMTEIVPNYQIYMDCLDVSLNRFQGVYHYCSKYDIPLKKAIISYLDLIQYHDNYYSLWSKDHLRYYRNRRKSRLKAYKGYLISRSIEELTEFTGPAEAGDREAELSELVEGNYREFLDYCKDHDINIMLVVSPCDYNAETMMEINTFARIAQEEYGYPFLNTNNHDCYEEMGIDFATDFYNHTHMNISGAEKYTRYVAAYLAEHYDLPDHRQEAAYAGWNEKLEQYLARADRAFYAMEYYIENGEYPHGEFESESEDDESGLF